jgi:PAS domain S-box-containing protein
LKRSRTISTAGRRIFNDGAHDANNLTVTKSPRRSLFRHPKTQLEEAIHRYVDLFDFAPIGYVTFNRSARVEEINFTAARLIGRSRKQLIGCTFTVCIAKEDTQLFLHHLFECRSSEGPVVTELQLQRRDGKKFPVQLSTTATSTLMKDGALLYQTAIVDLTGRKRAEAMIHHQAALINLSHEPIFVWTREDGIVEWNQGAERLYGFRKAEAVGKSSHELLKTVHPVALKKVLTELQREGSWRGEVRHTAKNGRTVTVESRLQAIELQGRTLILETNQDITGRKRSEDALRDAKMLLEKRVRDRTRELRAANNELQREIERRRGLEGQILEISDREQQRLGQELHDGLCQHLTAVAFMARSVALRLKNHRVIEVKDIEKIAELVNAAAADTRDLSRALHRMDVDAPGFVTALEDLVDREIWKTPCRLELKPSFRIEDDVAAAQLYRIAREAVINANKHAQAREIVVKLERSPEEMVLRVMDDGIGVPKEPKVRQGLGFHIMKYRTQLLGGRLEIDSPKKGGTRVSCYLPNHMPSSQKSDGKGNDKRWRFPAEITKALTALI